MFQVLCPSFCFIWMLTWHQRPFWIHATSLCLTPANTFPSSVSHISLVWYNHHWRQWWWWTTTGSSPYVSSRESRQWWWLERLCDLKGSIEWHVLMAMLGVATDYWEWVGRAGVVVGAQLFDAGQMQQAVKAANQAQVPSLIVSVFKWSRLSWTCCPALGLQHTSSLATISSTSACSRASRAVITGCLLSLSQWGGLVAPKHMGFRHSDCQSVTCPLPELR